MSVDTFLSMISSFLFLCGAGLVVSAWPQQVLHPSPVEILALVLGGVMVLVAGYGLAMVLV